MAPEVLASARQQSTIGGIEAALVGQFPAEVVRPVVLHLVWSGALLADLDVPLGEEVDQDRLAFGQRPAQRRLATEREDVEGPSDHDRRRDSA